MTDAGDDFTIQQEPVPLPPSATLPMQARMRRYVELSKRQKDLDAELAAVKAEKSVLEEKLLEWMAEHGIQNQTIDGLLVYIHRSDFASAAGGDRAALMDRLRADGHGWLIKTDVHSQSLSAWAREKLRNGETLPPEVEIVTRYALRTRAK